MNIEWQPIKRRSNLSLSIDQKIESSHGCSRYHKRMGTRWLEQSLVDNSLGLEDESFNIVKGSTKIQDLSHSTHFQNYKKYRSKLDPLNQLQAVGGNIDHLVNFNQPPKTLEEKFKESLNLSKYYTKFGPTIIQRVQPDFSQSLHGPNIVSTVRSRRAAELREYKRIQQQVNYYRLENSENTSKYRD